MRRVGLAGYGSAGRGIHAPLIERAGMRVAAVSTGNPARAAQVREDLPDTVVVPDLDALLDRDDLDLIVVATPTGDHCAHTAACIEAGRAVVVDKPLALTAADAASLVAQARRANVPLTVFQNRRYDSSFRTLQHAVVSGALGDLVRIEMRWERWRPVPKDRWRETVRPGQGGGLLLDLHSHLIDMATLVAGPITRVYAALTAHTTVAEDDAFLLCTHASGVTSHLSSTSLAGAPGPRFRVLGRRAAFVLNDFEQEPSVYPDLRDAEGCNGWLYEGESRQPVRTIDVDPADFYRAVDRALASGRTADLPVDPTDAVRTLAVIDAARESAATGQAIPL